nr:ribonucleases P/MRP protein subunit POP1 [Onthophagus taurus]
MSSELYERENTELPSQIRLLPFTAARCDEIIAMKKTLGSSKATKLIFQKLPLHMRRRVMSHNVKRLPRRLREGHMSQLKKSGLPPKQKRPSRKYRRRPKSLLNEYNRRQKKFKWLETHIWHAKRFHMIERWGYKLAYSPCDKAFRACYRATSKHCLLQDISYYGCIEINGDEILIVDGFKKLYDPRINMSLGAKAFINGNREGELMLFDENKNAIGNVMFNWKPKVINELRMIWIWCHPANFSNILNTLMRIFDLTPKSEENLLFCNESTKITIKNLKFDLNRFRLTGPLSHTILQKALKTCLPEYITDSNLNSQIIYWNNLENLASPSQLSPHIILNITAEDPRYNMPKIRTKALPINGAFDNKYLYEIPQNMGAGPIWNEGVRKEIKKNQIPTSKIYEMRSKYLVPNDEKNKGISVPYMLIQRPGNRNEYLGYSSGWDLIIPSGWALPTWLTLVMWGARTGGLRESESIQFEKGRPNVLEPDTKAGREENDRVTELYRKKYSSLPPNRRTNYIKYAVSSPFQFNWDILLNEWNETTTNGNNFFVLRDKTLLKMLNDSLNTTKIPDVDFAQLCLVPVKIILKKGCPSRYSLICLPHNQDLHKSNQEVKEPLKRDENQRKRMKLRKERIIMLKKMKKLRIKARKNGQVVKQDVEGMLKHKELMEKLWIPDVVNIRKSCSRDIMGFVTKGGFSFTVGKTVGIGYVALNSLKSLFSVDNKFKNKVLIRNTSSREYKIGQLEIVI